MPTVMTRPGWLRTVATGLRAGAAGTTVLNLVTSGDMAARGRPASSMPADLVSHVAHTLGASLGDGDKGQARAEAWGALIGLGSGLAAGVAGSVLVRQQDPPRVVLAAVLGAGVMLASNAPLVAAGLTDPSSWGLSGWLSDIVPHAAFGVATAVAL